MPSRAEILRGAGLLAAVTLLALAFIGSYLGALHEPEPHAVPVAVAGPPQLRAGIERGGAFSALPVASRAAALRAIDDRQAYAAVIASPSRGTEVITAPAASSSVASLVSERLVPRLRAQGPVRTQVVHALPASDSRGLAPFYLVVGWLVGGYLGATLVGLAFGTLPRARLRAAWRLIGLAAQAIVLGLLGALLAGAIALPGSFLGIAATGALLVFGVGAVTAGLQGALGLLGTGVAILLFVVLGNPSASGAAANELLPQPWRAIGPLLPTGAGVDTVRNVAYFGGHAIGGHLLVLAIWAAVGVVLMLALAGDRRGSNRETLAAEASAGVAAA